MLTAILGLLLSIYSPPIDYEISLAGNFGEPRPNHFHGGLDIRTEGVEGKHVYAIGDGYVSRVTMGIDGFGNCIYITHPATGHTSVYAHLKSFSPRIRRALRRYQYRHATSVADARLAPADVPVSQGQFIALSGNTGHSTAPHLHLEIHDTRTWNMLDPYQFLDDYISDSVAPRVHALMAVPLGGTFRGSAARQVFTPTAGTPLTATGRVAFAVWADDYMQGASNHYGISETLLYADGHMVFHSTVDNIPTRMNRMVNAWGDYDYWRQHRRWFMKSYVEPGNRLPCLFTDAGRGILDFSQERDYSIEYVLRDFKGNETRCAFTVRGGRGSDDSGGDAADATARPLGEDRRRLPWNRTTVYSRPGLQLVIPYGRVAADAWLTPRVARRADAWSDTWQFTDVPLPLMAPAELSIYARQQGPADADPTAATDPAKLYITDDGGRFLGGDYHDGWVTAPISDLGARYSVAYDATPPTVSPLTVRGRRLLLSVTDGGSGVSSWRATVDGRFMVFDAIEKTTTYACYLDESWLRPTGSSHRLRFEATDNRRNTRVYDTTFDY